MKKNIRLATTFMAGLTFAGAVAAETLKEVVTFTVETNPEVLSLMHRKDAADSATQAAFSGYLPRIDLIVGGGRERSQNTTTLQTNPGWVKLPRYQENVILNQMVWDGLLTRSEVRRRESTAVSRSHELLAKSEDIALSAIGAYLDVLKTQQFLTFAKDLLAAHQKTYDQVKLRADRGVGRRADLEQIEARLALAVSNVSSAESRLRDAEIAYNRIVGRSPVSLTMPEKPNIPDTVDKALEIGFVNHPTLKQSIADIDAAQHQRDISKSFYSPRLELELSFSNNRDLDGSPGPNRDRMAMMFLKWNLFRGGFDLYRNQETAKLINEAQEISRNTRRQVEAAVRLSYNAYATARDRLPSLERYVKSSDATRIAYAQQFNIGQRTLLDLLDSENEYFQARETQLEGTFIEMQSRFRVLEAMGGLLQEVGVKASQHAYSSAKGAPID